jgi:hypothetical protein
METETDIPTNRVIAAPATAKSTGLMKRTASHRNGSRILFNGNDGEMDQKRRRPDIENKRWLHVTFNPSSMVLE